MPATDSKPNLHQAAQELQRYLSDEIPPMMVVEHFEQLAPQPPEIVAKAISQWILSQLHGPMDNVATPDLIFHALKKVSLLAELELVRGQTVLRAIHEVGKLLLDVCPEAQRDELRLRLSHLGETATELATRAEFLHREASTKFATKFAATSPPKVEAKIVTARPDVEAMDRGARALSLLLSGLAKLKDPKAPAEKGAESRMLAQVLATAALESKTNADLARHLERIKQEGVATPMGQVFRALGWSLPGWGTLDKDGNPIDAKTGRPLKAMDRIVTLAPDSKERAKRWGEMIYAAVEQLNEGRLSQAVSILEVAKRLIDERKPDADIVGQVLVQAESMLSEDLLRRLADVPAKHGLLRKVLEFFPSYTAEMLLTHLDGEIRREKRKLILNLVECHGPPCRGAIITRLGSVMRNEIADELGWYRRNLAFLLRRIPRTGHERIEEEIELLVAMIEPVEPAISAKDAVSALGELRHVSAELALADRLRRLEAEMISRGGGRERWEIADRLCAALARHGSTRAIRAVAGHAYNRAPALGDALARFELLARVDLTVDPEQLAVLLKAIRELAASKVFGFVARGAHHELSCLMHAVAGTPTMEVRAALSMVAGKFSRHPLGERAQKLLAALEPNAKKTAEALTGDLELFGLPNLLQSLTGSESSGELVMFDAGQARRGSIVLMRGKLVRCEVGHLTGAEAIYALMEQPFPGTFGFRATNETTAVTGPVLDPMSVILEGARRHDEYQRAKAFAADGVRYEPAGIPAIRPEDENDGDFASDVWDRAAAGTPANECELEMKTDPFRVRRLYAHWVEGRALRPRV